MFDHDEYHRMPPRKKLAVQPAVSAAASEESSSSDDEAQSDSSFSRQEFDRDDVADQVSVFSALPTDTILSLCVGICARLQAALATLSHKPAMIGHGPGGHKRLIRDDLRVICSARRTLSAALNELLAIEAVLVQARQRGDALLRVADD